jgi:hypothetical protein
MFTRDIKCGSCGHEGKVEAHDTVNVVRASEIFEVLGKLFLYRIHPFALSIL